jgi:hypothetical protein
MDPWPFDQPPNCAVFTQRQIVSGLCPVLHVTHDIDDHGWQFLGLETPREEDAFIVCLVEMLKVDPSLIQVADLPPGWRAWRTSPSSPWIKEPNSGDNSA